MLAGVVSFAAEVANENEVAEGDDIDETHVESLREAGSAGISEADKSEDVAEDVVAEGVAEDED